MMATIYDASRFVSASWLSASFCSVHAAASSTLNTAKDTAKNCLRPCAIWDWKASCSSASPRFTGRDRRETLIKVKNPNAPAATRAMDGTFWKYFLGWTILNLYGFTSSHCSNRVADHDYSPLLSCCKSDRLAAASGATERSKAGRPRLKTND